MSSALRAANLALLASLLLLGPGCAADRYYEAALELKSRNPHASLEYVALCFKEDPEHQGAHRLVSEDLLKSIALEHEATVKRLVAAGDFETAVADADRTLASARLARTFPGSYQIFYENKRTQLAERAADKQYTIGQEYEQTQDWKQGAIAFRLAEGFRPNFRDAKQRYQQLAGQAKVYLLVQLSDPGDDQRAGRIVAEGLPARTAERGLEFLEFVRGPGKATSRCDVRVDTGAFYDSGWQETSDQREVLVPVYNARTKKTVNVKKRGRWTIYQRETRYDLSVSFTVTASRDQDPQPSGTSSASRSDSKTYANWSGDREAIPNHVLNMPNSPAEPKGQPIMSSECANACLDDLAHQLFLAYK